MAVHNELGREGESYAADYLIEKGYIVRHTNWRMGDKEIDLVAEHDGLLVVVEVKTRSSAEWGTPAEAVDRKRIMRLVSAANAYLHANRLDLPVRFDIISITADGPAFRIEHIEDAFIPPLGNPGRRRSKR